MQIEITLVKSYLFSLVKILVILLTSSKFLNFNLHWLNSLVSLNNQESIYFHCLLNTWLKTHKNIWTPKWPRSRAIFFSIGHKSLRDFFQKKGGFELKKPKSNSKQNDSKFCDCSALSATCFKTVIWNCHLVVISDHQSDSLLPLHWKTISH